MTEKDYGTSPVTASGEIATGDRRSSIAALVPILELCASEILKADGDRDYMNPSDLTVQQTTAIADYIRQAISALDRVQATFEAMLSAPLDHPIRAWIGAINAALRGVKAESRS